MKIDFWTYLALPIIAGVIVVLIEHLIIQPLAKKLESDSQKDTSNPRKKQGNRLLNGLRKIVSLLAKIPPKAIAFATFMFLLGIAFTISIAQLTNTDLANMESSGIYSFRCGFLSTGIAGQLMREGYNTPISNATITTSPPINAIFSNEEGYFSICNISPSESGEKYTIFAETSCYQGSVDVAVSPRKTTIAMIYMDRTCREH